jgi:hypothetical protein
MDIGLIVSFAGVTVATLAGVLGVWMERDPDSPRLWGFVFSAFILASSGVELVNTVDSTAESAKTDAKLATVLLAMSDLAAKGGNPALEQFVGAELAVQARANPEMVKKMEKEVVAKGGDASAITRRAAEGRRLASGLPADKPAAGERARLARPGEAGASRSKVSRDGAASGARTSGARAPGERTGAVSNLPGGAGKAVGKAGKATEQAAEATERAGKAAGSAAKAVSDVTGGSVDATKQVGAASSAARGATTSAAKATDSAAKATEDAKKATEDAKKATEDAKKKTEDAKKKADDKAKDALKGIGS